MRQHLESWPDLKIPSPVFFTPFPGTVALTLLLAPNVPNNTLRNQPFCSIALFLIVSHHLFVLLLYS